MHSSLFQSLRSSLELLLEEGLNSDTWYEYNSDLTIIFLCVLMCFTLRDSLKLATMLIIKPVWLRSFKLINLRINLKLVSNKLITLILPSRDLSMTLGSDTFESFLV